MSWEWGGFALVFVFGMVLAMGPWASKFPKRCSEIILGGFLAHGLGSLVRYYVLYQIYDGGDAGRYYRQGLNYALRVWAFDMTAFSQQYWIYAKWFGTQATIHVSGIVLSIVGPSKMGEFCFFAILAFGGLLLMVKAFERNYGHSNVKAYAAWVLLWPSLWFWPGSAGKDALILLASCMVIYGYAGRINRILWLPLASGFALALIIRPPVAGVLAVSLALAFWLSPARRAGRVRFIEGIFLLLLLALVLRQGMGSMGMQLDIDDVKGYIQEKSMHSSQGGSAISAPGLSITGAPMGIINVLFRPFPWEAGGLMAAASAEMVLFWGVFFMRFKRIKALAKQWRATKLLRVAIPFTILYTLLLGLAVGNLGIIARQRIHIMPLLLIWLEAVPLPADALNPARGPVRRVPLPIPVKRRLFGHA